MFRGGSTLPAKPPADLTGQSRGKLTVLRRAGRCPRTGQTLWVALCDPARGGCGREADPAIPARLRHMAECGHCEGERVAAALAAMNGRKQTERAARRAPPPAAPAPRAAGHPTTSEPQYPDETAEFLRAAERYRAGKKRPFMTASDYLAVLLGLGYRKAPG